MSMGKPKIRQKNVFEIQGRQVYAAVYKCDHCDGLHIQYLECLQGRSMPCAIDSYCPACGEQGSTYDAELQIADVLINYKCTECGHATDRHQSCNNKVVIDCWNCKRLWPHQRQY